MNRILGLHHITAIASDPKRNYEFYTKVLGLRMVKKTVNFDDPKTYHFYYGDEMGSAGTILTFFPWPGIHRGHTGTGMATAIGYSVPQHSLGFWQERFKQFNVTHGNISRRSGEEYLPFLDADGLNIELVVPKKNDGRKPWKTDEIPEDMALRGFANATLTVRSAGPTAAILTDVLGYTLQEQQENHYRFATDAVATANVIDIKESPYEAAGNGAAGTTHHIAFRVKDEDVLMEYREKVLKKGLYITPKINRDYFFSLYFREPGGVLFEIATDNPGFTVDEPLAELGTNLKLPQQYEPSRSQIEAWLPEL